MLKVAVTGGLSSGKSTVCHILRALGAYVTSADQIVHDMLNIESEIGRQVVAILGEEILSAGQIDRAKVAKKVFRSPQLLHRLEKIVHPAVNDRIRAEWARLPHGKYTLLVAEVPLLFEAADPTILDGYDYTIAVLADPQICRERFTQATGYDSEEFCRRSRRQLPPEEKAQKASFVICNNGSKAELEEQVRKLVQNMLHASTQ